MKEDVIKLLMSVKEPTENEWLSERRSFIGGSDVSALFGENQWLTDVQLYYRKIEDEYEPSNIVMRCGKVLEPFIKELYVEDILNSPHNNEIILIDTGRRIYRYVIDGQETPVAGTFDGVVIYNGNIGILECKSTAGFGVEKWYGGIPEMYRMQCIYYMGILKNFLSNNNIQIDRMFAHLAVLKDNAVFTWQELEYDEEMFDLMVESVLLFWNKSILPKKPPTPVTYEDVKKVYKQSIKNKSIEVNSELYNLLLERKTLKEKIKNEEPGISKIRKQLEEVESAIRIYVADAEYLVMPETGEKVGSILPDKNGVRRITIKEKVIF